jgi:hypothetical protein
MNSAFPGVADVATATRIVAAVEPLLHILSVHTVNVVAGTVYNVVFVAAARSAAPNLPVGIIYFSVVFSLKSS